METPTVNTNVPKPLTELEITAAGVEGQSAARGEPEWLLEHRRKAWRFFEEIPWPTGNEETWRRTKLTGFRLEDFRLLPALAAVPGGELPAAVSKSLGEVESAGSLALVDGAAAQATLADELARQGVIFTDLATAFREHEAGAEALRPGRSHRREQVQRPALRALE